MDLGDQLVWFVGDDYEGSQPLLGIGILPATPTVRENKRGTTFHFD
jgi:hypothetical protein